MRDPRMPDDLRAFMEDPGEPQLIDHRGGAAVALWRQVAGDQTHVFSCAAYDHDLDGTLDNAGASTTSGDATVGPASLSTGILETDGYRVVRVRGVVAPAVERVVAIRSDGAKVEATLAEDGLFLAWWPDRKQDLNLSQILILDADGEIIDTWPADD